MTAKAHPTPSNEGTGVPQTATRIIRRSQVQDLTGLKKSQIYALAKAGSFPRQIKLGEKAVGWIEQEVARWIDCRVNASRQNVAIGS